jgi:hypothetical protein
MAIEMEVGVEAGPGAEIKIERLKKVTRKPPAEV